MLGRRLVWSGRKENGGGKEGRKEVDEDGLTRLPLLSDADAAAGGRKVIRPEARDVADTVAVSLLARRP